MYDLRNNLPLLYDFYLVAKNKSFSKAAQTHNVSQPSLSRNVKILEEELKLKLINRNKSGIELTNDGIKLFKQLDEMFSKFDIYNESYLKNNDVIVGNLTIGTTRNILDNRLPFYLSEFYKKYPNIKVNILTDSASNLNDYLINHKIDVLIDYLPQINFSEICDLEIKTIGGFETSFACSNEFYNKNAKNIKTLKDLQNYPLVIPGASRRRQFLDEILTNFNIKYNPIIEMPDSKGMAEFIKNNDCIGYFIKEEIDAYNLIALDLEEKMPINHIGIIYSKYTINNITKKFVELVLEKSEN